MAETLNRLREAINETAGGLHRIGLIDEATFQKITARDLGADALLTAEPITAAEVRAVRERAQPTPKKARG